MNAKSSIFRTVLGIVTVVNDVQNENALQPIFTSPSFNVSVVKDLHLSNAFGPIVSTVPGIEMDCNFLQFANAAFPITFNPFGNVIFRNESQLANAFSSISFTEDSISTVCKNLSRLNAPNSNFSILVSTTICSTSSGISFALSAV